MSEKGGLGMSQLVSRGVRPQRFSRNRIGSFSWKVIRTILVTGLSFIILYPFLIKISVSFKSKADLYDLTVKWIPKHFSLELYTCALKKIDYFGALWNTCILSVLVTVLLLASCTLAAYAFARLPFKGSKLVFALIVFSIIVPPQTYMVATYAQFCYFDFFGLVTLFTGKQGVTQTYWPFIIRAALGVGIKSGLFIYILKQFFNNIPNELEEAAFIDGANSIKAFFHIMLPNSKPALVTVAIFSIIWQWNDSVYVSLLASQIPTLSVNMSQLTSLLSLAATSGAESGYTMEFLSAAQNAAALLISLPLIIMFILCQRFFVENLERSGIVG